MDPGLVHMMSNCEWDSDTMVLTTEAEKEADNHIASFATAAWYKDEVGLHMKDKKNKRKTVCSPGGYVQP